MEVEFGFENLIAWKKARAFKIMIARIARNFPASEEYKLRSQILKSSRSITALLAEGYGRFSYPDQLHFCIQARGSLSETINHLIDAFDENYIDEKTLEEFKVKGKEVELILNGYMRWLKKQKQQLDLSHPKKSTTRKPNN
jgi:four helix bundle protein